MTLRDILELWLTLACWLGLFAIGLYALGRLFEAGADALTTHPTLERTFGWGMVLAILSWAVTMFMLITGWLMTWERGA